MLQDSQLEREKLGRLSNTPIVQAISSTLLLCDATRQRRNFSKSLIAALCILSISPSAATSKQKECSVYWLRMWDTRSDPQKWSYVDLAYYAKYGAHPNIPGYSSEEVSLYLAALAIKNKQGLDLASPSISLEAMDKTNRAGSMRFVIAQFFGLSVPDWEGHNRPDQCVFSQSSACLERLARRLLPKAEKMLQFLEGAVRSGKIGDVPCEGGIQYFDRPRYR
ncbi:hypothetical protein GR223_28430 [Rhizobium leguminosarum]|uniref:hypothetical protein n=1 Tax=Rhizobium ruizarguesonis TaxID=2081791 RepID=UPI00103AC7C8|nr:hypothetical protein [Rhizobium ruizarguesonis]MBY5881777.1 hypothetical protein [Rhizobium leguminosarum]TCA74241.1 hypothetical protein E0H62_15465 [Rhizobium leguminosarum bv. viciae]NEH81243.1 hypothetical protein [Rhizobium ruizarguesonis]NEI81256.1 hypothetical protein [Rhizobium ruizarguesonis]NEJ89827.1 hypothetical protein [Rhizobium ruizarguesonis]